MEEKSSTNTETEVSLETLLTAFKENNQHLDQCQKTIKELGETITELKSDLKKVQIEHTELKQLTQLICEVKLSRKERKRLLSLMQSSVKFKLKILRFLEETDRKGWNKRFFEEFPEFESEKCCVLKCMEDYCCFMNY